MTRRMINIIAACTLVTAAAVGAAFSTDLTHPISQDTRWDYTATDDTPPPTEDDESGTPSGEDGTDDTTWG